jgi:hypothetical protein
MFATCDPGRIQRSIGLPDHGLNARRDRADQRRNAKIPLHEAFAVVPAV